MKKVFKILAALLMLIVVGITGFLLYLSYALPNVGDAPDLTIEATPARLARGEYLATSVAACLECHSKRDFSRLAGPINTSRLGEEDSTGEDGCRLQYSKSRLGFALSARRRRLHLTRYSYSRGRPAGA